MIIVVGLFKKYRFIFYHSAIFVIIYITFLCFRTYVRFFYLVNLIDNGISNNSSNIINDITYFTTNDIEYNLLRDGFGIEREGVILKRYIEIYHYVRADLYDILSYIYTYFYPELFILQFINHPKYEWGEYSTKYTPLDIKANNLTLSRYLKRYGRERKIYPTSDDLKRFEQTIYSDDYEYIGDGIFYQHYYGIGVSTPYTDDRRASFYIWRPKTISVLGKKESNKIVPTQYYDLNLGVICEGIKPPKYLIELSTSSSFIIYLSIFFTVLSAEAIIFIFFTSNNRLSLQNILLYSYFLVTLISHYHFIQNSAFL